MTSKVSEGPVNILGFAVFLKMSRDCQGCCELTSGHFSLYQDAAKFTQRALT